MIHREGFQRFKYKCQKVRNKELDGDISDKAI